MEIKEEAIIDLEEETWNYVVPLMNKFSLASKKMFDKLNKMQGLTKKILKKHNISSLRKFAHVPEYKCYVYVNMYKTMKIFAACDFEEIAQVTPVFGQDYKYIWTWKINFNNFPLEELKPYAESGVKHLMEIGIIKAILLDTMKYEYIDDLIVNDTGICVGIKKITEINLGVSEILTQKI